MPCSMFKNHALLCIFGNVQEQCDHALQREFSVRKGKLENSDGTKNIFIWN